MTLHWPFVRIKKRLLLTEARFREWMHPSHIPMLLYLQTVYKILSNMSSRPTWLLFKTQNKTGTVTFQTGNPSHHSLTLCVIQVNNDPGCQSLNILPNVFWRTLKNTRVSNSRQIFSFFVKLLLQLTNNPWVEAELVSVRCVNMTLNVHYRTNTIMWVRKTPYRQEVWIIYQWNGSINKRGGEKECAETHSDSCEINRYYTIDIQHTHIQEKSFTAWTT